MHLKHAIGILTHKHFRDIIIIKELIIVIIQKTSIEVELTELNESKGKIKISRSHHSIWIASTFVF